MDMIVKIPKRFKKALLARFDYKNKNERISNFTTSIQQDCPLCTEYMYFTDCHSCPFYKFETKDHTGCFKWTTGIIGTKKFEMTPTSVVWFKKDSNLASKQLTHLKTKALELITWI